MPHYEHVILMRPEISRGHNESLVKQFKKFVESEGGTIGRTEFWGLRPLAYRMGKARRAHYSLMDITADPHIIKELNRKASLDESVIRQLTVRVAVLETGSSAMQPRRDRDGRRSFSRGDSAPRRDRAPRESKTRSETVADSPPPATAGAETQSSGPSSADKPGSVET